MNLSYKWLQDFVKLKEFSPREFAADLTMSGSKVEGYEVEGAKIQKIVVGKVLSVDKHPGADSLFICKIDTGDKQPLHIITAATNVVPGAFVPVALDGSVLASGKEIHKGKLRGELSEGMLCSLEELGLTKNDFPYADENGIFLLEEEGVKAGEDIREALGLNDTVFEFEITSNRPDCLSVLGLAREVAATYDLPITIPTPIVNTDKGDNISNYLSVELKCPMLCMRYGAAVVKNVKIGPSPRWMRERLRASGVRPINNIVDITNYVMLEYGQPMHAFDLRHVRGNQIVVRAAHPDETITTLDGVERKLSPEMLVIADAQAPSAIAGVMGGEFSGVYEDTQTVVFESACFYGPSVRSTSRKLGLRTESSSRFEKGLDPHNCLPALARACELVEMLQAGTVVEGILDVAGEMDLPMKIPMDYNWINNFLGTDISRETMVDILERLDFTVEENVITVPSYRGDCEGKADIAEEIARIYGYDKIPSTALQGLSLATLSPQQKLERLITQTLLGQGLSEITTYSFISPRYYDNIALPEKSPLRHSVVIQNPLGEDTSVMRTTAIPSMMEILSRNYNNRIPQAKLFELATIYLPEEGEKLPEEKKQVMLGMYGDKNTNFFTLKGAVEVLLSRCGICEWEVVRESENATFHPGRCAKLIINDQEAGILGEIHPLVCEGYGIGAPVYLAALDLNTLQKMSSPDREYHSLPKYPASTRDLALVCDEDMPVAELQRVIKQAVGTILEKLDLFDVYRGKQVGEKKKSVAFSLTLRSAEGTLTDDECDQAVASALNDLEQKGVQLRG